MISHVKKAANGYRYFEIDVDTIIDPFSEFSKCQKCHSVIKTTAFQIASLNDYSEVYCIECFREFEKTQEYDEDLGMENYRVEILNAKYHRPRPSETNDSIFGYSGSLYE